MRSVANVEDDIAETLTRILRRNSCGPADTDLTARVEGLVAYIGEMVDLKIAAAREPDHNTKEIATMMRGGLGT